MSDTTESLSAILAEMRRIANNMEASAKRFDKERKQDDRCIKHPHCRRHDDLMREARDTRELADRIEAAAKREEDRRRDEVLSLQRTIVKMQDAIARQADAVNAAALRVALENARSKFIHIKKCADEGEVSRKKLTILCEFVSQEIAAALAAPARNCDRFATEDEAREAYWAYRDPLEFNDKPFVSITEWLFAPAEGGEE